MRGCPDLLAMYTTKYEGSVVRQTNVKVAARYAGDALLKPDQEYDLDQLLGPRTRERESTSPSARSRPSPISRTPSSEAPSPKWRRRCSTRRSRPALASPSDTTPPSTSPITPWDGRRRSPPAAKNLRFVNDTAHHVWIYGQSDGIANDVPHLGHDDGRRVTSSKGEFYNIIPKTAVTLEDENYPKGETATVNAGQDGRTLEVRRTVTMPDGTVLHDDVFTSVWEIIPGGNPGGRRGQVT